MASAEDRRANADIARNLKIIGDELKDTNHLLRELLKLELRHEEKRDLDRERKDGI